MANVRSPLTRLAILGGIWGCSFLFIKVALDGLPPLGVALSRTVAGAAVLWVLVGVRRLAVPRQRATWRHLTVLSVFANVLPFVLFAWAEEHVSSGVAGIYNATTPLMTLVIAMAVLPGERPTRERTSGVLLGLAGTVLVLGPWRGVGSNSVLGQLACLAAAASYGVAFVYTRRHVSRLGLSPVVTSACQLTAGVVLLGVAAPAANWEGAYLDGPVLGSVLALGALGTGIAFVINHGLIRDVGPTTASMVTFLIPIVAVALGAVVLDEPVTWNLFAGGVVVILGVALAEGRLRRLRRQTVTVV